MTSIQKCFHGVAVACLGLAVGCTHAGGAGGGGGGKKGRGGGGQAVSSQTTPVQRIAVQRQVDLAGTLLSPDQAKVSSEAAGVVRSVLVEIGREVKVGDPLVRLEPRELALALARAESALRQTRAQLGMADTLNGGDNPPADEQIGSVKNALASLEDAKAK